MEDNEIVAQRYSELTSLSKDELERLDFKDNAIFEIVNVRCEMDMGGILSPWEQYFRDELHFDKFIEILTRLNETILASKFITIKGILSDNNFWETLRFDSNNKYVADIILILEDIERSQLLWEIDKKVVSVYNDN